MITTILFTLISLFLLMLTLRTGYIWGKTISESLVNESIQEEPFMEVLKTGDPLYKSHDYNNDGVKYYKVPKRERYWIITGPRSN